MMFVPFCPAQLLQSRQLICQLGRLVDQDRQVLGANPILFSPVFKRDQGHIIGTTFAVNAIRLLFTHFYSVFLFLDPIRLCRRGAPV